ncbi:PorP/SprF family type IX secretion system membrane protein [Filimonas effusa]|uniref:Type IX secretion system membrane protein PorP/SprF n=1 Tax=Filimonas effusa TaxID=2508721 RepID=A0A4Q1DAP3_9BACT|nr:type IX secretion system membrane protein PorP/SprF [Filimonas effusa]RXK85835.1 type IX secretion system membrane protein PorP/SprF [Filimonas effusa]
MIRRLIAGVVIVCTGLTGYAQQKPHYTQYILNQYVLNPALTGIENYTDVKLSHRQQWAGLNDAPVTSYFTIHGALNKKDYRTTATSFQVDGTNPRGNDYWADYTAAAPHHGIGLQVINDKTGPLRYFSAYATYAYHLGIGPRTSLSAGFGAGIFNASLDANKLNFGNTQVDPAVYNNGVVNSIKPDLMAGLYLYGADYFLGVSVQQLMGQSVYFSSNKVGGGNKMTPHIFVTAGYRFLLDEDWNLIPSVMLKSVSPLPLQPEGNVKLQYRDFLWAGGGYRKDDGWNIMAGVNISGAFNIGYSYDRTTSALNTVSNGSHEVVLGILLGNKYGDWCPRNVW